MPTLKYKNGTTWTTIPTGVNAGFATPTATINNATGTPSCTVTYTGDNSARKYNFAFTNVKGSAGAAGGTGAQGNSGNTVSAVTRRIITSNVTLPYLAGATNPSTMAVNYNSATTITGDSTLASVTRGVRASTPGFIGISASIGLTGMSAGNTSVYTYVGWAHGTSFPSSWSDVGTWQGKDQWMYVPQIEVTFPENVVYITYNGYTLLTLFAKCYNTSGVQARADATTLCVVKYG